MHVVGKCVIKLNRSVTMPSEPEEQKKRNQGDSAVYGISATQEFWDKIARVAATKKISRSAAVVLACSEHYGFGDVNTKRPGRPRKKTVKGK
jgi:hypothetical protein